MRCLTGIAVASVALAAVAVRPSLASAQANEETRRVSGGGISVPGWMGKVDDREAGQGLSVKDSRFMSMGGSLHVVTGPATTFWNPANKASGDYTVKATFNEPKYMELNDHPHPYGIVIAGNDMGTDKGTYLYCAAYGNGVFIVRGFGPAAFQMNGGRGQPNDAVHKAAGKGKPVSQDIALSVKGDKVTCNINGTDVATYTKADLQAKGLRSTDGVYGVRFAHNTEGLVVGLKVTKP